MNIEYITGDATDPIKVKNTRRVIVHCCNAYGGWGAGIVLAISKKWSEPESSYRRWHQYGTIEGIPFQQGQVHVVPTSDPTIAVANLIGQSYCGILDDFPPVRYGAIEEGLIRLKQRMGTSSWSLHAPRFGCGLAGGDWLRIEEILMRVFEHADLTITIYDLKSN